MTTQEKEAYAQRALELLEDGAKADGTTLTQNQCEALIEHLQETFDTGYACGANNAAWR